MTRLPDFVVLGQGKAGTSLIYRVFEKNTHVGLSKIKELLYHGKSRKPLDWYISQFDHLPADITSVGEVSPAYLDVDPIVQIHETLGADTRMIYVLRHPIEQAYSRYLQNICGNRGDEPAFRATATFLGKRLDQVEAGLQTLYELFPRDQILSLMYEIDVDTNQPAFEAKICDFIGVPRTDHMASFRKRGRVNAGVMPRFLHGGSTGLEVKSDGQSYRIPADTLVFCAQPRNTEIYAGASAEQVARAVEWQSKWTSVISKDLFAQLQNEVVVPRAEHFERSFGINLDHWRIAPRQIAYDEASPPPAFLLEGSA